MPSDRISSLRETQRAILELFASSIKCEIGLLEPNDDGEITELGTFGELNPYCMKIRSLPGGYELCRTDHLKRAKRVIKDGLGPTTLCHAGVFNQAVPIAVDGKVRAVLMHGQIWVEGHRRCADARRRHKSIVRRLGRTEDDEAELRAFYEQIKRGSTDDIAVTDQWLSLIQQGVYEVLAQQVEMDRQTERVVHELQTRAQPALAYAENLYYGLCRLSHTSQPAGRLIGTAKELLQSLLAMRALAWNLGKLVAEYQFEVYSLQDLVDEAKALYQAEAQRKWVRIFADLEKPSEIEMSRRHLQQAINNLVHNAIKYSFHGTHRRPRYVSIGGEIQGSEYVLTISNYGVGILPEEYDRIFESGYRGQLTRVEDRTGSGKGLTIVREVVEKHHGAVEVKSAESDGNAYVTTFTVRLPLKQPPGGG